MLPLRAWFLIGLLREFPEQAVSPNSKIGRIFTGDVVEGAVWLVTGMHWTKS